VADPLASNQIKVDLVKLSLNGSASPITSQITESKISSVVLSADTSLTSSKSSLDNILVENDLGVPVNSTIYGNQANASTPEIFAGSVLKDTIVYGGSGTDIFTYITPGDIFLGGSGTNDSLVLKGLRSSYTLEYIKDLPDTDYYSNFKDATNIKDTFFPLLSTRYNNLEDTAFSDDMAKLMRIRQDNWDTNEYALVSVDKFYFNGIEYLSDFIIAKEFSWTDTGTDYSFNEVLGYANQEGSLLKTINVEASKLFQGNYSIFQNDIKINVLGNSSSSGTNPNDFFNNPGSYTRFQLNDFVEKFSINTGGAPQAELSDLPKGVDVVIDGNSNNNIIKVSGYGKAIINGVGGNDTLVYSGKSSVKIDGGEGDDFIVSSDGNDFLLGGIGNDVIFANGGNDAIVGGGGNDLISGGDGDDDIQGLEGNDQIFGGLGNDTISGGKGNDQIFGNSGHDTLNGDSGNDYINGGTGGDIIDGGSGNDTLEGGAGFDRLEGNSGDDVIFGGDQSGGVDKVLSLNTSTLTPLIESSAPASTVTEPPTNPLIPNFKDIMLGGSGDDVFILGKGTSTLTSTVYGGSGNDTVVNSNQSGTSMVALDFLIKPATVPTNYANLSNGGLFVA
jgi:Ca2+-binding RTX toxin-like protein